MERSAGTRIVIADDHPIFRRGLRHLLESEPGFSVVGEAADGHEAVQVARAARPDILLLDLTMPGVSGLEALEQLSRETDSLHVIMLTASIEKSEVVKSP